MKNIENLEKTHQKFVQFGTNAKKWIHECKLLLPEIAEKSIWEYKGFGSIYEYAGKLAGLSHGQVDDALWILRKALDKPALMEVAKTKGINSIRPIISIATKENSEFLAKKAREMSKGTLEVYIRGLRAAAQSVEGEEAVLPACGICDGEQVSAYDPDMSGKVRTGTKTIAMELSKETAEKLEKLKIGDWEELMQKFIELHEEKLAMQKPTKVSNSSHHIPKKIKEFVIRRSGGRCEYMDCRKKYDHLHHTERFSINREHDPDKIRALCKTHHDLMHHNLVENETKDPQTWKVRLEANTADNAYLIDEKVQRHKSNFLKQNISLPIKAWS
ncbi:HNH endonuclease [Candidatus Peregrinibacteria bacterium]|nr:HNH endonuclease [Candidatus Peregrinibacteria bacterium]